MANCNVDFFSIFRWLTKSAGESITDFLVKISAMLDEFAVCYEVLHPRARIAVLGIASTALKLSTFKIDNEKDTLVPWLPSSCVQGKSFLFIYFFVELRFRKDFLKFSFTPKNGRKYSALASKKRSNRKNSVRESKQNPAISGLKCPYFLI